MHKPGQKTENRRDFSRQRSEIVIVLVLLQKKVAWLFFSMWIDHVFDRKFTIFVIRKQKMRPLGKKRLID